MNAVSQLGLSRHLLPLQLFALLLLLHLPHVLSALLPILGNGRLSHSTLLIRDGCSLLSSNRLFLFLFLCLNELFE